MKNKIHVPLARSTQILRVCALYSIGFIICCGLSIRQSYGQETGSGQITKSANDVPRVISYQGVVSDHNGIPLSDNTYMITASFYEDALGLSKIWQGIYAIATSKGIFNIMLGSGDAPLPPLKTMNKPIWVGVQVDGSPEMRPLTQLASSPYTLNIPDNSVTKAKMGTDYIGKITINGQEIKGKGAELNILTGDGIHVDFNPATNDLLLSGHGAGKIDPQFIAGPCPACFDINPPSNFIGNGAYNIATGGAGVGFGFATVSGGYNNGATADYATIGGGAGNLASGCGAFVGGGGVPACPMPASNVPPMAPTGFPGNTASATSSAVLGGTNNAATFDFTAVGGGQRNTAQAMWAYVGGGHDNIAGNGVGSGVGQTVGGGEFNKALIDGSVVAGGEQNTANDMHSSICGGFGNTTAAGTRHQHIGGGLFNTAIGNFATIGGGQNNTTNTDWDFIGGGTGNVTNFMYNAIGGGQTNTTNADWAFVGGGHNNVAGGGGGITQTVGGGEHNQALGDGTAICGGEQNTCNDIHASICGGIGNTTLGVIGHQYIGGGQGNNANAGYTTIGGGQMNTTNNDWATVGGGVGNIAGGGAGPFGITQTVGGGDHNSALGDGATIAGGEHNTANSMHDFIGGGIGNVTVATAGGLLLATHNVISGGAVNTANGQFSSIPGGLQAVTRDWGQMTHASGIFGVPGDAQTSVFTARNQTAAGSVALTSLFLDGAAKRITVPTNGAMTLDIIVIGKTAGCGGAVTFGGWQITVTVVDGCAGAVIIGVPNITPIFPIPAGWGVAVAAGAANPGYIQGTVDIQVTSGGFAQAVDWVARVQTAEVIF